ncbi:MAG: ribonuclease HII [Burkholderiaceae bacterium]
MSASRPTAMPVSASGIICGVDEAGRGPLAGPVYAAAVILDPARPVAGLRDSKRLSAGQRDRLAAMVRQQALAWAVASASPAEIDAIDILQASLLAMRRAVLALARVPELVRIDGKHAPVLELPVETVIGGDDSDPAIAAASILAKTSRDAHMLRIHAAHPGYGFDRHKGYPTAVHLDCLARLGPCEHHRRSFAPVRRLIDRAS